MTLLALAIGLAVAVGCDDDDDDNDDDNDTGPDGDDDMLDHCQGGQYQRCFYKCVQDAACHDAGLPADLMSECGAYAQEQCQNQYGLDLETFEVIGMDVNYGIDDCVDYWCDGLI
jgi:hypothetical protein